MQALPKILLVDGNPDFSYTVNLTLDAAGYHLLTAKDGQEALNILLIQPVHLVLSEATLPDMTGYQLHRRLRSNPEWAGIPFVVLTANGDHHPTTPIPDAHLSKPLRPVALIAAVRRHISPLMSLT